MNSRKLPFLLFLTLLLAACDGILADQDYIDAVACSFIPRYAADCMDPEVQEKVVSVLTNGAVAAEIHCNGVATGPGGKFVALTYKASRLQDDSCNARVDLFGPNPPNPGLAQSSASELTRRGDPRAAVCAVESFHTPGLRSNTSVVSGVLRVEGAFCTTTPGSACTLAVATNCTGDITEF